MSIQKRTTYISMQFNIQQIDIKTNKKFI